MSMKVVITSAMRDATSYLPRYITQVQVLKDALASQGAALRVLIAEGDSKDETWDWLQDWQESILPDNFLQVQRIKHGGRAYGSIDKPQRWKQIAWVYNCLYEYLWDADDNAVIYVEADLIWTSNTMLKLLAHLKHPLVDAVAPMCFHTSGTFYDIYGYRKNGEYFTHNSPYHPALRNHDGSLIQVDTVGSCQVMLMEVAQKCKFSEDTVLLGHSIYEQGFRLWLDPKLKVLHP